MVDSADYLFPDELYYDRRDHMWVRVENSLVRVGLDQIAQKSIGSVVYVKILAPGSPVIKRRAFGAIEAGKFVGPLRSPVNGKVVEANQRVIDSPELVNSDPYGGGWLAVIEPSDLEMELADLLHGEAAREWLRLEVARQQMESPLSG